MDFFECEFPGNSNVFKNLCDAMERDGVVAFTGAGTSMPELPSWTMLLEKLIGDAVKAGLTSKEDGEAYNEGLSDPLFIADRLSIDFGSGQLKSKVCAIFQELSNPTAAHRLIAKTSFRRLMTLNYDLGLELASSEVNQEHLSSITANQQNELQRWESSSVAGQQDALLHWHGITTHAEDVILTGDDYSRFYDQNPENSKFLSRLFTSQRVFMIGFGFNDPFITRPLEGVMRLLHTDTRHFALLGVPDDKGFNVSLERKKFATKYKIEAMFYPVKIDQDGGRNHSGLQHILEEISKKYPKIKVNTGEEKISSSRDLSIHTEIMNLFSVGGKHIYFEPNIWSAGNNSMEPMELKLEDLIFSNDNFLIQAPHEYGLTTLGKRIATSLRGEGQKCIIFDSNSLPKYKKKLIEVAELKFIRNDPFSLVLDNFSSSDHERLLDEVNSTFPKVRIVLLQRSSLTESELVEDYIERGFRVLKLHGLRRENIREVVKAFLPVEQEDHISLVVEKVYSDLTQLCIPLTPANAVMYTSVLCKDGDFTPVSRLHIVDRFITEALQRASDAYADSFNINNKMNLISSFCIELFEGGKTSFSTSEWLQYCKAYRKKTLVGFNARAVLSDLIEGRILWKNGEIFIFRYKMFYSYFVGRYVAVRPEMLEAYVEREAYTSIDGLVEVICGLASDSSPIIEHLTQKLKLASSRFYDEFPLRDIDAHKGVKWERGGGEEELWDTVTNNVEEGPKQGPDLDRIKTSISAESRTIDQKVEIVKLAAREKNVSFLGGILRKALENATNASAEAKLNATEQVIASHQIAYEVATIFAPMIASRKYMSWNGFSYVNLIEQESGESTDEKTRNEKMVRRVLALLPYSIATSSADYLGSRKLGEVFREISNNTDNRSPFSSLLIFTLLLRSKPEGWEREASRIIRQMPRDDIYLYHMLSVSMKQFKSEVNTLIEGDYLKKTIAEIRIRRDIGLKSPNRAQISKVVDELERQGIIDK
ncbi:SIR2-like domain-containing protein [Monaibacterium marinum]|uniref:SIR2-like domain-containing protein n=1 Tax=Pontivivens marinum TaxID=1690039 RepID=A0A2C9CYZ9_9RHOB|nr:SIR2 family protein [Monaibacterium marinum]SOH95699.1 SIR2-like domain-containing protein [Monaibacterium marinum]